MPYISILEEAFPSAKKVDHEQAVVHGVKLLGQNSKNGYRYTPKAMKQALEKYEGARVFANHIDRHKLQEGRVERDVRDSVGCLRNVREQDGSLVCDVHCLKSSTVTPMLLEAAERMPGRFGLSHWASVKMEREGDTQVVTEISRVMSADLVNYPATTSGIFESWEEANEVPKMPEKIKAIEAVRKVDKEIANRLQGWAGSNAKLVSVIEADLAATAPLVGDAGGGSTSDDQMKSAFRAMVVAAFDDDSLDTKATVARIKEILSAYDKVKQTVKPADAATSDAMVAASVDYGTLEGRLKALESQVQESQRRNTALQAMVEYGSHIPAPSKSIVAKALEGLSGEEQKQLLATVQETAGARIKPAQQGRPIVTNGVKTPKEIAESYRTAARN